MAGHSKWANIKHKKAKEDAKRGNAFTKISKEITVVAREGGGDPAGNPRLRTLIHKAKQLNMPQDNIVRAIKKGTGELPGVSYEACTYEGYGPHSIAVIVDTLTDNKNRTVAEMRRLFSSKGGSMGETGSVSWMFENMGVVRAPAQGKTEDELLEALLDFPISDIKIEDGLASIYCEAKALDQVRQAVEGLGLTAEQASLEWVAKTTTELSDAQAEKAYDFLSALDDHDDVQNVYTNLA